VFHPSPGSKDKEAAKAEGTKHHAMVAIRKKWSEQGSFVHVFLNGFRHRSKSAKIIEL
jgi:hypothetical protein